MTRSFRYILVFVVIVAAITIAILRWHKELPVAKRDVQPGIAITNPRPSAPPQVPPETLPPANVAERLDAALAQLTGSRDPQANRQLLAELRRFLETLAPAIASRELRKFLEANKDAATNLDVTIKAGGQLGDASSLRVFLLDYLGQIDRTAAGVIAAQILSQYTTPDEWAVSLRNYAWANPGPEGEAWLQAKSRELLSNAAWLQNPSAGFLEAFDTIVHARGTALTPELTTLVRDKEHRATAHAAYLTLDRLTITEPAAIFKQLVEQPDLMQGREQTRANFLARADVRQPEQRALVEQYLLDPARTPEELVTFAGLYPNANYMISNNLLTATETPKHADLIAHDLAALEAVRAWQNDPRFANLKPHLETMRKRLEGFVQQAAASP